MAQVTPIRTLLDAGSFNPDEINVLVRAFEEALRELRLGSRDGPAANLVAQRIISLARQGERNPVRLRQAGVKGVLEHDPEKACPRA